jgi:REP element-mobilizing transposase RayT
MVDYWQKMEEGQIYHVYNRSISNVELYYTDENCRYFLKKWNKYFDAYFDVYAYCLIPNHFHFLVKVKPIDDVVRAAIKRECTKAASNFLDGNILYPTFLEDQFKRLFSGYAQALNRELNGRRGAVLEKRFKRVKIKTRERFLEMLFYIHHNPIHHGLFGDYDVWAFSSYQAYFSEKKSNIKKEVIYKMLNDDLELAKKQLNQLHIDYKNKRFNKLLEDNDMNGF